MMYNWNNIDDTVNRYVGGVMSEDETDRFEEYFLGRPEIIGQIEVDQVMLAGLQDLPVAAPGHRTDGESQPVSWRR